MTDATRSERKIRKPRLFVQVAESSLYFPLQFFDENGQRFAWLPQRGWQGPWGYDAKMIRDILRTHVEVPL